MIKTRLVLPVLAASAALFVLTGCGGSSSSSSDPASLAPPESALFLEGTLRPSGSLKTNIEELAKNVAGVEDLGGTIVSKLEESASNGQFDYAENIEPWLGEKAGMAFPEYDGNDFANYVIAIQSTDTGATQDFIDNLTEKSDEPIEDGSYEGVDFKIESEDETALGVVGDFLVFAQNEAAFKEAVDAFNGKSLAEDDSYTAATSHAPADSLLNVYVDIGGLIEQAGGEVDKQTEKVLEAVGIEVDEATALASLVPGSDTVEVDITSDLGDEAKVSAPADELLESLPADSIAAVSAAEYGERLQQGIDSLDANGIPGQVPPHQLEKQLEKEGIDIKQIAGSLEDAAVFAVGSDERTVGGAVVLTTKNPSQAKNTVANVGLLLRSNHTPGVTAISGKATGFSIRGTDLGPKPVVVAARGDRIAIGYGLPATLEGLSPSKPGLAENEAFQEAAKALGDTPMTGFVDGPAALALAEGLVSPSETGFGEARPFLEKIAYIGFGGAIEDGLRAEKLIVGLKK